MIKTTEQLYAELKDDIGAVAGPLFELSEKLLNAQDSFLPHAFVLNDHCKDVMVGSIENSETGTSTSTVTLPLLHEGLRMQVKSSTSRAIGVAENVVVTVEGGSSTNAIKVLFEHREGLCLALYLPFKKKLFGGYQIGQVFTVSAKPEVKPWAL